LMMDPMTGQNRGYAFLSFLSNESAIKCVQMYDKYEIRNKEFDDSLYTMSHI
jgi:heterogeneous nuclear ribonucleoprotein R